MKPLTIEQLKALPVGEWVWVKFLDDFLTACWGTGYAQIKDCVEKKEDFLEVYYDDEPGRLAYVEYGKTWLAWKNKEQAESKGEIKVGDTVFYIQKYFNDATLRSIKEVKQTVIDYIGEDFIEVNNGVILSHSQYWNTREEAQRRLAELTKE